MMFDNGSADKFAAMLRELADRIEKRQEHVENLNVRTTVDYMLNGCGVTKIEYTIDTVGVNSDG